ncbi:inactive protein RESTRICTED TEV MOVEMENT 2-like [Cynara cardunculus var. scolymus]|uniref:inactive protein RESTRICTED TEV MOVEMENT 2-like n=1 Tax=Cynara cardunculus var. scolymus TaxID=59895 RepID=UPI000D62FB52|nr:inactive protein RESTRICTED TEV MOVEMENT 2-like [Cynara cardunculus var. scolymus]
MARRPRGGEVNTNRPQRTIIGRVYEPFKPISEWKQEDHYDALLIYLPGFRKEFMKLTVEYPNKLRVRGEHLVAGNKWNRFREDFEVPKNCKMSGIRAKFDGGILTVTIPRKINDAPTTTNAATIAAATTPKSKEPMKNAKQDHTDTAKRSSSSNLDATDQNLRPQPPAANPGGLQPPLDGSKSTEGISSKVEEYKRVWKGLAMGGMKEERAVVVNMVAVVVLVVALGVYVSYAINGTSSYRNNQAAY